MSDIQYHLLAKLEAAFDHVTEMTEALVEQYRVSSHAAWALDNPTPDAEWLRRALFDFWYLDGQDGRVTRTYVGLIAADSSLMEAVARVNAEKVAFASLIRQVQETKPGMIAEIKASLPFRHPMLNEHLKQQGLARLHLKQSWRHIPVADTELSKVRMSWYSSGRSIQRFTVNQVEKMLLSMDVDAPHIRIQLKKLASIPSGEPLARVQRQAPLMRANLFFRQPLNDGRLRRAMNVALPLFVPSPDGRLPDYNIPPPFPPEKRVRAKRSDERLEEEAFLPSLRVYRYRLPDMRQESGNGDK
ncbi:DNA replication terminus site-binding protein [Halomonas sp. WWR20]